MSVPSSAAEAAAALLVEAHRSGRPLDRLPPECRPASFDEAHAIQDAVTRSLGPVGGWKVGQGSPDIAPSCAPVYLGRLHPSGVRLPASAYRGAALEIEFAFEIGRDLPPLGRAYIREEVLDAIAAFRPCIELQGSRYRATELVTPEENLADGNANGALILGGAVADWRQIDFRRQRVRLLIDGIERQTALDSHPAGDPLVLVHWLANHLASRTGGLRKGEVVTTGSLDGATPVEGGIEALGDSSPLGTVALSLV